MARNAAKFAVYRNMQVRCDRETGQFKVDSVGGEFSSFDKAKAAIDKALDSEKPQPAYLKEVGIYGDTGKVRDLIEVTFLSIDNSLSSRNERARILHTDGRRESVWIEELAPRTQEMLDAWGVYQGLKAKACELEVRAERIENGFPKFEPK